MMPEEWPIAEGSGNTRARISGARRNRLATVRADFFLPPEERLTEQERALMTAMLHCLVRDIAGELRAALPAGAAAANDESDAVLVDTLARAELVQDDALIALLLRRADEERIANGAKARSGRRDARTLQGLVSHDDGAISAAAMALILARGRRRDRLAQCLVAFDDLAPETAERLVHAVAAFLRQDLASNRSSAEADSSLAAAAHHLLSRFDPDRSVEALTASLVRLLADAGALGDDLILAAAAEGEAAFLGHAFAHRAAVPADSAVDSLLSGEPSRIIGLLRAAGVNRDLAAGLLASVGDLLGIRDAGGAIDRFDSMTPDEVAGVVAWLSTSPAYRAALVALDGDRG